MLHPVEVLENIGTENARVPMERIAKAAPIHDSADQARGALERLKQALP